MRLFAVLLVGGMILACAAGKDSADDTDSSLGLPEDAVDQDAICADYLDCLASVDPGALASVQSSYGTNGTCWTDEATAEQCAEACATGLAQMHDAFPDEPECDDGEAIEAGDLEGRWNFESTDSDGGCDGFALVFDSMDLEISPDGSTDFTADGRAEVEIVGTWYDFDLTFACSLSGDDFRCDEAVSNFDTYWTFEGVYRGTDIDATLGMGLGDGEGALQCTEVFTLVGETI